MHSGALKLCVIGLGNMGRNHVRAVGESQGATLVGASDPSAEARSACPLPRGLVAHDDWRRMLDRERPDAVIVAVPAERHVEVATEALARGVHVLVEKPIATTLEGGRAMQRAARAAGKKLMIGHIERFNPAVVELKHQLSLGAFGRVLQLQARRLSPLRARVDHVGVAVDLATHDIDLMHFLTGSRVVRSYAETGRMSPTTREDMLSGLIRFASGEIGTLDVSWMSPTKQRRLFVVAERGTYAVDYLAQELTARVGDDVTPIAVNKREPLRAELDAFLSCVLDDTVEPVTADDALAALDVALSLAASGDDQRVR